MPAKKADSPAAPTSANLNREDIERLIQVIHEKGIEEFELEQGGMRVRIVSHRNLPQGPVMHMMPVAAPAPSAPAALQGMPAPAVAAAGVPATPPEEDPRLKKVTSPMVGTFYRAPSPGAKTFVEVGDKVEEDSVLCIIEAMKLMNEIKAETRGTVRKILVENGTPVEYGQVLFLVDPG